MTALDENNLFKGRGYTYTDEWRRITEARHVNSLPTIQKRRAYIAEIEKKRGREAALQLQEDMLEEWGKS